MMNQDEVRAKTDARGTAWHSEIARLTTLPLTRNDVVADADVAELFEVLCREGSALTRLGEIREAYLRVLDEIGMNRSEW